MAETPSLALVCRVAEHRVAFWAVDIFKVLADPLLTRFPNLPWGILGITAHRGRIVTVADAGFFLFEEKPRTGSWARSALEERVLLLDRGVRHLALRVDAVESMEEIDRVPAPIQNPATRDNRFLSPVKRGEEEVAIVDVKAMYDFLLHLPLGG